MMRRVAMAVFAVVLAVQCGAFGQQKTMLELKPDFPETLNWIGKVTFDTATTGGDQLVPKGNSRLAPCHWGGHRRFQTGSLVDPFLDFGRDHFPRALLSRGGNEGSIPRPC